jgi:hypothetical protein
MLVFGPMQQGGSYWCYVAVKPSQYAQFQQDLKAKKLDLHKFGPYGEIIVSGEGLTPPQEVTSQVIKLYGADPRYVMQNVDPMGEIHKFIENINKIQPPAEG